MKMLKSKCPKCGSEAESYKSWTITSPRSEAMMTTYQFRCKKCGKYFRRYRVPEGV